MKSGAAVVGVGAVLGFCGGPGEGGDAIGGSHLVGLAHAHIDEFSAGIGGEGGAFGAFDFFEFIDGGGFAVELSADAVCEEVLDKRVHGI